MWSYNGEEFTSEMIGGRVGFVYEILDKTNDKKYIGKKKFWSKTIRPPLKGKKRKRKIIKESDWQSYHGSSEEVKTLVEECGTDRFERKILHLCDSLGEMSYIEMREQIVRDVLLKPDEYYNAFVGGRIHRNHVKNLKIEDLNK
jgi:hypothetical protein